ncbi:MAG TPA: FecR domain-containing protein [Polyangiaceae bacterium]|nr:FecR domain-containing protein [Polyangiaceae bacterium]
MSRTDFKNVVPVVTEARLARQYAAIRERLPAEPGRRRAWAARGGWAVAALAVAALAFVIVRGERARTLDLVDQAVIESGQTASVTLADGSRVDLGAATRARLTSAKASAIRIDLDRGTVDIEATHVEGRTFVVGAGPYEVHVVGTHFMVRREAGTGGVAQVTVQVTRGAVEVTAVGGGEPRRLAAGEQWSGAESAGPLTSLAANPPPPAVAASPAPAVSLPPAVNPPASVEAAPVAAAAPGPHHDETARDLFDDGQRARAEGRAADAARSFDRLRRTYPRDPRAALSAFELGRLRLDALGDPRGAEEALRDAIALGPSSPFREDAEARRVEALRRAGDPSGCAAARSAYLARWPNGTYRRAVEVGCGD